MRSGVGSIAHRLNRIPWPVGGLRVPRQQRRMVISSPGRAYFARPRLSVRVRPANGSPYEGSGGLLLHRYRQEDVYAAEVLCVEHTEMLSYIGFNLDFSKIHRRLKSEPRPSAPRSIREHRGNTRIG